jgi:nucleoid-associated protein YgaU
MEWRLATWTPEWIWLEPVLAGTIILALTSAFWGVVRVRRRRPARTTAPPFVQRIVTLLGIGLTFFATPSPASGRTSAHPGRSGRPLLEAPWRETSGFPPPRPLVPSGGPIGSAPKLHPAIHAGAGVGHGPLFERAGRRASTQREGSRRLHPAGDPGAVKIERNHSVTVLDGDCLWTIAAEVLSSDDAQRVDAYWRAIFRLNRAAIGSDPDRLFPGQTLRLPRKTIG